MRILILENDASSQAGGAERSMRVIAEHLARNNKVYFGYCKAGDYVADVDAKKVYSEAIKVTLPALTMKDSFSFLADFIRLSIFIARNRVEHIVTHMIHVSPLLRLLKILTGTNYSIYFKWVGSMNDVGSKVRWGNAGVSGACAVSRYVGNYWTLNGIPQDLMKIVPEGCPVEAEVVNKHEDREKKIIGFAGRLLPMKGLDTLIMAMPAILQRFPRCELRIAGVFSTNSNDPGAGVEYQKAVQDRIAKDGLADHVRFDGFITPLEPWIADLDVLAVPSIVPDAQPLVMMQSMSVGTPVVATRVGGIPEILDGPFEFLLVQPECHNELSDRIIHLLADSKLRKRLGRELRMRVEANYSMRAHFDSLLRGLNLRTVKG